MAEASRPNKQTTELKAEIARSRDYVARDLRGVRYEMDIPRKIRRSFRRQTAVWVGTAVVVGTVLVLMSTRKKKVYVDLASGVRAKPQKKLLEAGFALGVLKIAMTLFKPAITNFVMKKMHGYADKERPVAKW
jgi:hypothetical protein